MPRLAASLRLAALSPMARMASGGGPTQRIPASITRSAKSAFSARKPKPGWSASAFARRAAATTASAFEEVDRVRAVRGWGTTARMPSRSHVRVIRVAISPRFAMKRVRIGPSSTAARHREVSQTRQSRQTRHANDHQPAWRAAHHWRSSAEPTASTSRAAARPRSGSVRRSSCRDCRTFAPLTVEHRRHDGRCYARVTGLTIVSTGGGTDLGC